MLKDSTQYEELRSGDDSVNTYNRLVDTLKWVKANPKAAAVGNYQSSANDFFLSERVHVTLEDENDIFRIIKLLILMGAHRHVNGLTKLITELNTETEADKCKGVLQKFLNNLYLIFDEISTLPNVDPAALKQLKKYIGAFAENHQFQKQLFNLDKIALTPGFEDDFEPHYLKLVARIHYLNQKLNNKITNANSTLDNDVKNKLLIEANAIFADLVKHKTYTYVFIKKYNLAKRVVHFEAEVIDAISKSTLTTHANYLNKEHLAQFNKKYSDRDHEEVAKLHKAETYYGWIPARANPVSEEKKSKRRKKYAFNWISKLVTFIFALGEGVVAAILTFNVGINLGWVLAIGIGGAIANYFLMRNRSFTVLQELFIKNKEGKEGTRLLYCDKNGNPFSQTKQNVILFTVLFSLMGGATYGILSFHSCMLALAALSAPPGWTALAAVIAIISVAAVFVVFYRGFAKIIGGMDVAAPTVQFVEHPLSWIWQSLCNIGVFFGNRIVNFFVRTFVAPNYKFMSKSEVFWHGVRGVFHTTLTLAAWAATIIVSVAMAGLFRDKAISLFVDSWHLGENWANIIVTGLFDGCAAVCNTVFLGDGIFVAIKFIENIVVGICSKIYSACTQWPSETARDIRNWWNNFSESTLRATAVIYEKTVQAGLLFCSGVNAVGQGFGPKESATSHSNVSDVTEPFGVPPNNVENLCEGPVWFGSGFANFESAQNATATPSKFSEHKSDTADSYLGGGINTPSTAALLRKNHSVFAKRSDDEKELRLAAAGTPSPTLHAGKEHEFLDYQPIVASC